MGKIASPKNAATISIYSPITIDKNEEKESRLDVKPESDATAASGTPAAPVATALFPRNSRL